jgi:pyrroline-5-carboxylate reductase
MFAKQIAIVGAGHLGSALARGLIQSGHPAHHIKFSNRSTDKLKTLSQNLGVLSAKSNQEAVHGSDLVVLAVKPQFLKAVCEEISPAVQMTRPFIISLAGVINTADIASSLQVEDLPIVRVMTNTPIEHRKGMSALFANPSVNAEQKSLIEALFEQLGDVFWVEQENMLNTLTAAIGCSPAYVFLFLEALEKATISRGIPPKLAAMITKSIVAGSLELTRHTEESFAGLGAKVATPSGVTAASLEKIDKNMFFKAFADVYAAAEKRIEEIEASFKPSSSS